MATLVTSTVGTAADYATLELWEAGEEKDLVAADEIARAALKNEVHTATFTTSVTWATDATRFIWIDAESGAEHDGTAGSGARLIEAGGADVLFFFNDADNVLVSNLEISTSAPSSGQRGIRSNTNGVVNVDRCLIHGFNGGGFARGIENIGTTTLNVSNSLIYDCDAGIRFDSGVQASKIYNTVIWNDDVGAFGMFFNDPVTSNYDCDLRNSLIHGGNDAIGGSSAATKWNAACDQNIVSDGTGTSQNLVGDFIENATFQAGTGGAGTRVMFISLTGGSEDLHIEDDAANAAKDFGNNLTAVVVADSVVLVRDLDGTLRPASGSWDAGADQILAIVLPPAYGNDPGSGTLPPAYGIAGSGTLPPAYPPVNP